MNVKSRILTQKDEKDLIVWESTDSRIYGPTKFDETWSIRDKNYLKQLLGKTDLGSLLKFLSVLGPCHSM